MNRRSFVLSLFGGAAAAGLGGATLAQAAATRPAAAAARDDDAALKAKLDGTDADFTQHHNRRVHARRPVTVVRRPVRRRRRVVRNGRVYYIR